MTLHDNTLVSQKINIIINSHRDYSLSDLYLINVNISTNKLIIGYKTTCSVTNNYKYNSLIYEIPISRSYISIIAKEVLLNSPLWIFEYEIMRNRRRVDASYDLFNATIIFKLNSELINDFKFVSTGLSLLIKQHFSTKEKKEFKNYNYIPPLATIQRLPASKIILYPYQQANIKQMMKIEATSEFNVIYTTSNYIGSQEIIYDPIQESLTNSHKYMRVQCKGGILADEMGLGKTITCLSLCTLKPPTQSINNNVDDLIVSKATLIICLSHLAFQWKEEAIRCNPFMKIIFIESRRSFEKCTIESIKNADIILITSHFLHNFNYYPRQHYKCCTANTINLIERSKFIKDHYKASLNNPEIKCLPMLELFSFERIIIDEAHQIYDDYDLSISSRRYIRNLINSFTACYKWAVSGTPFTDFISFALICKLIDINIIVNNITVSIDDIFDNILKNNDYSIARNSNSNLSELQIDKTFETSKSFILNCIDKSYIIDNILNNICIRHMKDDVGNQINIPDYKETIKWIELSEIEKKIYDSNKHKKVNTESLQRLCSHVLLSDMNRKAIGCDTIVYIEEIRDKIISYHKINIKMY
jgi:SNF2 family DNA or RNA helicase